MVTAIAKAYIPPQDYDETIRYLGHVERSDESLKISPTFDSLLITVGLGSRHAQNSLTWC